MGAEPRSFPGFPGQVGSMRYDGLKQEGLGADVESERACAYSVLRILRSTCLPDSPPSYNRVFHAQCLVDTALPMLGRSILSDACGIYISPAGEK